MFKYPCRSVHNIRIERLWRDVRAGYVGKWVDSFTNLEQHHGLDVESDSHMWLLHYLYLNQVNDDAVKWAAAWNRHPMRLPAGQEGGQTPISQYLMGLAENGLRGMEDSGYEQEGDDYGVDWGDLENSALVQSILKRRGDPAGENGSLTPAAAPPHWSKVEVRPPAHCPITPVQLRELDEYICSRVEQVHSTRMDARQMLWVYGLQYLNQLNVI